MIRTPLLFVAFFLLSASFVQSQNYLRVVDPDNWNAPISSEPGWHDWLEHGAFDEVSIVATPQGIYTQVELYATIFPGPNAWSWQDEFEIIWQFELPANAIVHDSWLWVEEDIIKADVVDYWTALETYEGIVDRNEDPSFLYRLPDNRYEIRIYPLFAWDSRRIKMSFLIPTDWTTTNVTSDLLQQMLEGSDFPPATVSISTPVSDQWTTPRLMMDHQVAPITDLVVGGNGTMLNQIIVSGVDFVNADGISLINDAPLSDNRSFLSTYSSEGEHFYQLAYLPDWEAVTDPEGKNTLLLLDYDEFRSSLTKTEWIEQLQNILSSHLGTNDALNAGLMTSNGIQFLSSEWINYDPASFPNDLADLLSAQDVNDLEQLLLEGFTWVQNQNAIDQIFLIAANDELVYPPIADDVMTNLEDVLPTNVPFQILDFQDENLSIVYYNNEAYQGNAYFYQELEAALSDVQIELFRDFNQPFGNWLNQYFPANGSIPTGILDFTTSLESGLTYQRYNLSSDLADANNLGVILQTGKYLGEFPFEVEANLISDDGQFWSVSNSIAPSDIILGDTVMREMWYGPHLRDLETLASSTDDRNYIIEQSIKERVLTGLTAFLALEPNQGGEPCIDCLLNNGNIFPVSTHEQFVPEEIELAVTPNPASEVALIRMAYPGILAADDWTASIFDASGRFICTLDLTRMEDNILEWEWQIDGSTKGGIYFCNIVSEFAKQVAKVVVVPR